MKKFTVTVKYKNKTKEFTVEGFNPNCAEVEALGEACAYFDPKAQSGMDWDRIIDKLDVTSIVAA